MSTPSITGRQARELLDGTTPGPWTATKDHIMRVGWEQRERERSPWADDDLTPWLADESDRVLMNPEPEWKPLTENRADMLLAAAAPDLAQTVAWLYTPDGPPDGHDITVRAGTVWLDSIDHTPDEAVDLARALLAAAEGGPRWR